MLKKNTEFYLEKWKNGRQISSWAFLSIAPFKLSTVFFAQSQGAIWMILGQGFENRSYVLKTVVLKIAKLSCNVSPYWWDTL